MTPAFESEAAIYLRTAGGGQSEYTRRAYSTALSWLKKYLSNTQQWSPGRPISDLAPEMFTEFPAWLARQTYQRSATIAPRPLAESSREFYLVVIGRFIRFLTLRRRLPLFDLEAYTNVKEEFSQATHTKDMPIDRKIPPRAAIEAIMRTACTPPGPGQNELVWARNLAAVEILRASGCRVGELVTLKRADLDPARLGAWTTGKGRKMRFIAFDNLAWSAIQNYLELRGDPPKANPPLLCRHEHGTPAGARLPICTRTIQFLVSQLARRAGINQRFYCHSFRHRFATDLLNFTGNLALVQEALGHADPKTTRVYTSVSAEQICRAVRDMGGER